jgi:hypothetical protein
MKKSNRPGFRNLLYKWVVIKHWQQYSDFKVLLKDFKLPHLFGFIYIDHECGLTLDVIRVFSEKSSTIASFENLRETGLRAISRYESFIDHKFEILSGKDIERYNLPDQSDIIEIYSSPEYEKLRAREGLDPFRSEGFPDDIKVFLFPLIDLKPEQVWCRLEKMRGENQYNVYEGILLNQPYQDFKVNMNETVEVIFSQTPYGTHMVCKTSLDRLKG